VAFAPIRSMAAETYNTWPDLLIDGGRLASTEWSPRLSGSECVAAMLRRDPEAVVLRVVAFDGHRRGLAPGGLGA
jgi:hypothetical protein